MPARGQKVSQETKDKISAARKGRFCGMKNPHFGKHHSEEALIKIREARRKQRPYNKGLKMSEAQKHKISNSLRGKKQSAEVIQKKREAWNKSEKCKLHLQELNKKQKGENHPNYGKKLTQEQRKKISGQNASNWQGGISFEPYCVKFNNEFKERVRAFFGYCCIECGSPQIKEKLHVHHVNYRKDACCNEIVIPLFVPLCRACHIKTQRKRAFWQKYFTNMINSYYMGRCYLSIEEMKNVKI